MKIFISGIAGFLGSHLADQFINDGHHVVGCDSLIGGELNNVPEKAEFYQYDCCFRNSMLKITKGCDIVYHTAATAYEGLSVFSPHLITQNIVTGSVSLFSAAIQNKVKRIIALSTDKAALPINLYGASKLASDKLFTAANNISGSNDLKFSVVRYGNVFGSRGSVVPLFLDYKDKGKKVYPVTDQRMTRFWITLDQAVNFVSKTFDRMQGGETFVPKIPSVKILDVLKAIDSDYKFEEIGIRPVSYTHLTLPTKA